jgi:hypothetical protein
MIELGTGNNINMFEVHVIDTDDNDVAASKPSSQSSTLKLFNAGRAVDGDISTFSHTDVSVQAAGSAVWWKVALGDEFRIKSVTIKNRYCSNPSDSAGCLCRLTDATVSLLNHLGTPVATQSVGDTCGKQDLLLEDFIPFETPEPTPSPFVPTPEPTPSVETPEPTSSPTLSSAPSTGPVEGFTYVGEGYCLDSEYQRYSRFSGILYNANDNDCMKWCSQVLPHPDFVAVEVQDYGDGKKKCRCDFSGGLPEDVDSTDYSPRAKDYISYSGVGPVQNTDGAYGFSCYRYHVSFLGCMGGFYYVLHLTHCCIFRLHEIRTSPLLTRLQL